MLTKKNMIIWRVTYTWQIIRAGLSEKVEDWSDVTTVSTIIQTPEPANKLLSFDYQLQCNFRISVQFQGAGSR